MLPARGMSRQEGIQQRSQRGVPMPFAVRPKNWRRVKEKLGFA